MTGVLYIGDKALFHDREECTVLAVEVATYAGMGATVEFPPGKQEWQKNPFVTDVPYRSLRKVHRARDTEV